MFKKNSPYNLLEFKSFLRETEGFDFTGTTTWVLSPWRSITQYFILSSIATVSL